MIEEMLVRAFRQTRALARDSNDTDALARLDEVEKECHPLTVDEQVAMLQRVVEVAKSVREPIF